MPTVICYHLLNDIICIFNLLQQVFLLLSGPMIQCITHNQYLFYYIILIPGIKNCEVKTQNDIMVIIGK